MIKLIAIDIDGTLLDSSGNLSQENKKAIAKARTSGIKIVLASGRSFLSMKKYVNALELFDEDDYLIANNGALIQETNTGEILYEKVFKGEEIRDIYHLSKELKMPINLIHLDKVYEPKYLKGAVSTYKGANLPKGMQLEFSEVDMDYLPRNFKANQIVVSRTAAEIDLIIKKIPKNYFENYTIDRSLAYLFEILPKNSNKGQALKEIQNRFGFKKEETMAIGDQENDISLLKNAGIAIAMGNSSTDLKAVADYQTKSNDENGLAHALNKFLVEKI